MGKLSKNPNASTHSSLKTVLRKNGSKRVQTVLEGESLTDQSLAQETDVNYIVNKYMKTGQLSHLRNAQGSYQDVSEFGDTLDALNKLTKAQNTFDELPSQLRERFGNSPIQMVEFLQNPANHAEAIKLGMMTPKPTNPESRTRDPETTEGRQSKKPKTASNPKHDDTHTDE